MEPSPANPFSSFGVEITSPTTDDLEARRAQQQRVLELVREREAEHGPVDPAALAEIRAHAATWPA